LLVENCKKSEISAVNLSAISFQNFVSSYGNFSVSQEPLIDELLFENLIWSFWCSKWGRFNFERLACLHEETNLRFAWDKFSEFFKD